MRTLTYCENCGKPAKGAHRLWCGRDRAPIFWAKVNKTDSCWLWTGAKTSAGYGDLITSRKHVLAHRFSYQLANGPIAKGLLVLHKCDTPLCVRPDHLFLGTDADNVRDKVSKDRHSRGERNKHAKLTEAQVLEIRRRYRRGNGRGLGRMYGVTQSAIAAIICGRSWGYLK